MHETQATIFHRMTESHPSLAAVQFERPFGDAPPGLRGRLRALVEARNPVASLSPADLTALERIRMTASVALLLDLTDGTLRVALVRAGSRTHRQRWKAHR